MLKVAILGPESTGKSVLTQHLSEYFNAAWVPEYAREYIEKLSTPYTYDDVCKIALKQIEQEKYYEALTEIGKDFVFFDTDLIITKVWFEYKYREIPEFLTERMKSGFFDFYLLCTPDLPWESDPVREHGDDREFFFGWYKTEIEKTGKPYFIVTGINNQRFKNAIDAILIHKENSEK